MSAPESGPTLTLAQRRQALLVRSALLREQMASSAHALEPVWSTADRVNQGIAWVRSHPLWVGATVGLLAVWRPRKTLSAGVRLWGWWKTIRQWSELIKK